jgi:uncharacterized protein (TIGR03067 family)
MKRLVLVALALGLVIGADKAKDDSDKDDDKVKEQELKKIQGRWEAVSREQNGKSITSTPVRGFTLTITDDKFIIIDGRRQAQGTFTVEPGKSPKQIDLNGKYGQKEIKLIGIYEFRGNKLKICYTDGDNERPTEFSTRAGTLEKPIILSVYQRAKRISPRPKE